jgi:hypothetical protein
MSNPPADRCVILAPAVYDDALAAGAIEAGAGWVRGAYLPEVEVSSRKARLLSTGCRAVVDLRPGEP